MSLRPTTSPVRSVRFFCAASITARRSLSFVRCSPWCRVEASSPCPTRCCRPSSRSEISRAKSLWREPNTSATVCSRPVISDWLRTSSATLSSISRARSAAAAASAARSRRERRERPCHREEQHEGDRREGGRGFAPEDRAGAELEGDLVHGRRKAPANRWTLRTKDERFDRLPASPYLAAMPVRPLVILPDPRLRLKSEPVDKITPELRRLAADMLDTMYDAPGVGLAAIQIGVPKRLVVMDTSKKAEEERRPVVLVNPEIVWASEEKSTYEEGCLSIPEYYEEVERPTQVKFRYTDLDGKTVEVEAEGLLATCRPARDRPPRRRALHRPPVAAEARAGDEEIRQGGKARAGRRRRLSRVPGRATRGGHHARRLHGHAGLRRPDARRDRRPGTRGRGGLHPRAGGRRARHGAAALAGAGPGGALRHSGAARRRSLRDRGRGRDLPRPSTPTSPSSSPTA